MINGVVEVSGTLSCPAIADFLLKGDKRFTLEETIVTEELKGIIGKVLSKKGDNSNDISNYYCEIRQLMITTIYNKSYSLYERIILIGFLLQRIQVLIQDKNEHLIPQAIIGFISNDLDEGKEILSTIPSKLSLQIQWLSQIASMRMLISQTPGKFKKYYIEFINGLDLESEPDGEEIIKNYNSAYEIYSKFKKSNQLMFENYLAHSFFQEALYDSSKNDIVSSYNNIIINYNVIELMLIGISKSRGEMNLDIAVEFIQSFTKVMNHNLSYKKALNEFLINNDMNSLSHLSILTKRD